MQLDIGKIVVLNREIPERRPIFAGMQVQENWLPRVEEEVPRHEQRCTSELWWQHLGSWSAMNRKTICEISCVLRAHSLCVVSPVDDSPESSDSFGLHKPFTCNETLKYTKCRPSNCYAYHYNRSTWLLVHKRPLRMLTTKLIVAQGSRDTSQAHPIRCSCVRATPRHAT